MAKHSGWQITSQLTDQYENTQSGQTLLGVRVYFVTGDGNEGSVFVPNNLYNAKTVKERVNAQAAAIDEVGNLFANPQ